MQHKQIKQIEKKQNNEIHRDITFQSPTTQTKIQTQQISTQMRRLQVSRHRFTFVNK
jgi:division protein CdvB (Snf7/Vps24/ESCRT-III family)